MTHLDTPNEPQIRALLFDGIIRAAAVSAIIGAAWFQAWSHYGSTLSADWLGYAVLAALVLATILAAGAAVRPSRADVIALGALAALAVWETLSAAWSPLPALARDDGFLTAFYVFAFAVPLLVLRGALARLLAASALVFGMASLAIAVAIKLAQTQNASDLFSDTRLAFPISYPNAQAAMFLIAFWPAIALAARRTLPSVVRALACGAATSLLSGWLLTQSKGGGLGLLVSAVAMFAVSKQRLRLVLPTLIAGGTAAAGFYRLTEPYRAAQSAYLVAVRGAGSALLGLTAMSAAIALVYAVADRRVELGERSRKIAGIVVVAALAAAVVAGTFAFLSRVDSPSGFVHARWESLKAPPGRHSGSSHFSSLGSNRLDFWRVSVHQFPDHPIAGAGARSFWTVYVQHRGSDEMPIRGHSLELDTLLEDGLVGLGLLVLGIGALLVMCFRQRDRPISAAAFAGGAYWLAHTAVDWNWNVPAAAIPFFVLLGIGAARGDRVTAPRRRSLVVAGVVAAVAVLGFAPVWLSGNLVRQAFFAPAGASRDLRLAKRLDPLSPDPYVMQSRVERDPAARVKAIAEAVRMEPKRFDFHYQLGVAYLNARRRADAARELRTAARLDPRNAKLYLGLLRRPR